MDWTIKSCNETAIFTMRCLAEQATRAQKQQSVANFIGYERLQILLDHPELYINP